MMFIMKIGCPLPSILTRCREPFTAAAAAPPAHHDDHHVHRPLSSSLSSPPIRYGARLGSISFSFRSPFSHLSLLPFASTFTPCLTFQLSLSFHFATD